MKNESAEDQMVDQDLRPPYEPPQLFCLDAAETQSGAAGAFESTFPAFPDQSILQSS